MTEEEVIKKYQGKDFFKKNKKGEFKPTTLYYQLVEDIRESGSNRLWGYFGLPLN